MNPTQTNNIKRVAARYFGPRADCQAWMLAAAGLSLLIIVGYSTITGVERAVEEPVDERQMSQFASMGDVAQRKAAFFAFLEPYVHEVNTRVLQDRAEILKLQQSYERVGSLSGSRLAKLQELLGRYGVDDYDQPSSRAFDELLLRADTIPTSLALAQAAIESGWGTSRFAREGNNLFGMWCYEPGCGMVPRRRPAGRTYEVAAYASPRDSFEAYLANLNTNPSYAALREIRHQHRSHGVEPSGHDLAGGLVKYSQERWVYVDKVRTLIASNDLER